MYLFLADSIKHMLGTCQNEVNYHWFSCDSWHQKRVRHVWGRLIKSVGLIAAVSWLASPPPSVPYFSYSFPVSFSLCKFLEMPATQAMQTTDRRPQTSKTQTLNTQTSNMQTLKQQTSKTQTLKMLSVY